MKVTQEEVVDRQTVLHIELEEEDLPTYLDRGYQRVVQRAMIPGFRKGKAPRAVIERFLGRESLLQETLDYMLPDVTERAVAAQELETAGTPKVELLDLEPVTLKATVALKPHVDLGMYRDLRVDEEAVEITEEDVQGRLDQMLREAASWEPVERSVKLGDMVTMDVEGTVEGHKVVDEKDTVYVADEETLLPFPGFSRQLGGATVGEPKEFTLTVPDDYPDARIASKKAHLTVVISEVKEQNLPKLDDEFARGAGDGYETLDALSEAVERELKEQAENARATQYRENTLDELVKVAAVELPPLLVEHEIEHMVERRNQFVDRLNMRTDDYLRYTGKTEEQFQEEMHEHAVERLTRSYALATIAEHEGVDVSPEEIDERIQTLKVSGDGQGERQRNHDLDSDEVRSSIHETLLVGKALDRLTAIARGEVAPEPSGKQQRSKTKAKKPKKGGNAVDKQA